MSSGGVSVSPGILFGLWMKERREHLGLTQEEVMERMALVDPKFEHRDGNYVSQLEVGRRTIPPPELVRVVALALGATQADALRGAGYLPAEEEGGMDVPLSVAFTRLVGEVEDMRLPENARQVLLSAIEYAGSLAEAAKHDGA